MEIRCVELQGLSGHKAGRQLLALMYRDITGQTMPEIQVTDRGKPYFADGKLYFSISHTPRRVFCALSEKNIGIDAEEMDRAIDLRLADRILSPAERQQYDVAADKRMALLRLWVLKEASAKHSGEGLRGYPNKTDFSPDDPRIKEMNNCLVAVIEE